MQEELGLARGPRALSVSQVTQKIKGLLELEVGELWVRGEISNWRPSAAGHLYFNLKDEGAVLSCAMFKGQAARSLGGKAKFTPNDGLEVIVHGRVSVYPPRGNYQLIVDHMEPVGAGALQLAFEQLKKKLMAEGLFEQSRKRALPQHPSKIAVITSPTGAVIQDILNVLGRRNAGISVLVVPVPVQGEDAPEKIVRALATVNEHELADVIVVARGGGSIEDLWCFNDESLVRAVAASKIPVISAVGHETDFTLCDFAADLRAPTPSAAAEIVSRSAGDLVNELEQARRRLASAMQARISKIRTKLLGVENKLISPGERLARLRQVVDDLFSSMELAMKEIASEKRMKLERLAGKLDALSPLNVLGRGFALVEDAKAGGILKTKAEAVPGREINLVFKDGKAKAKFT